MKLSPREVEKLMLHNAGFLAQKRLACGLRLNYTKSVALIATQVHPSSVLRTDDEGVYPNYVVYHELISTSHPYMRNVCEVEMEWVTPILQKLEKLNVKILSGGSNQPDEKITDSSDVPKKDVKNVAPADDSKSRIQAAREGFLARKGNK